VGGDVSSKLHFLVGALAHDDARVRAHVPVCHHPVVGLELLQLSVAKGIAGTQRQVLQPRFLRLMACAAVELGKKQPPIVSFRHLLALLKHGVHSFRRCFLPKQLIG
jgi:hypothetical protein